MNSTTALLEREAKPPSFETPHLSYSRISRYLLCPDQYRFHYVERLRPRLTPASLVFGQVIHQSLTWFFQGGGDPVEFFVQRWNEVRDTQLKYAYRESWEKLLEKGQGLLELFIQNEAPRLGRIVASEKPFEISITSLGLPVVGVIDLLAEMEGVLTVVDFKTSASAYADHEVVLSDQLTAYHLAEPDALQSAFCVLVKTKEPRIDWHFAQRDPERLIDFLAKVEHVARSIVEQVFYRRPGQWCAWCDYLPICMGDKQRAQECLTCVA